LEPHNQPVLLQGQLGGVVPAVRMLMIFVVRIEIKSNHLLMGIHLNFRWGIQIHQLKMILTIKSTNIKELFQVKKAN